MVAAAWLGAIACSHPPSSGAAQAPSPPSPPSVPPSASTTATAFPIVELRQYTLRPGQRDVLIELFEREFLESQEAVGMTIFGQFRDLDRPDRFVWFRGFRDMPSRAEGLQAFYVGPVWQAHRAAANATIDDSDNVLLLHPSRPTRGFSASGTRAQPGATVLPGGLFVATIYTLGPAERRDFAGFFEDQVAPQVVAAGATIVASFVTEHSPNNFPRLPVRDRDDVFVWVAQLADPAAYDRYLAALAASPPWRDGVAPALAAQIVGPPEVLRLAPTARSRLHGAPAVAGGSR